MVSGLLRDIEFLSRISEPYLFLFEHFVDPEVNGLLYIHVNVVIGRLHVVDGLVLQGVIAIVHKVRTIETGIFLGFYRITNDPWNTL